MKRALRPLVRRLVSWATVLVLLFVSSTALSQSLQVARAFELGATHFEVRAAPGMEPYADRAADVVVAHWARIAEELGAPEGETVRLSIEYRFNDWFEREGVASRPPEWAAGLAIPSLRVILLAPGNPTWESTLEHELAHIAVAIASGDQPVPAWFNEGMAVRVAEQWSLDRVATLVQSGRFHDFRELEARFPAARDSADLAYAQSFHFVRWSIERWGDALYRDVLRLQREDGRTFHDAFAQVTGTMLTVAYGEWQESARVRYRWAPALMGGGLLGLAILVLIVSGWRRTLRRRGEAMARLASRDATAAREDADDRTFGG